MSVAPATIAVVPAAERERRGRLFDVLEQAYPVRFAGRAPADLTGVDGAFLIAAGAEAEREAARAGVRLLVALGEERAGGAPAAGSPGGNASPAAGASPGGNASAATGGSPGGHASPAARAFDLGTASALDSRLRGQRLSDPAAATAAPVAAERGDAVLASRDGQPLWTAREDGGARRDTVALVPAELEPGEALRARVEDGRALALLPLLHLVRELTATRDFTPPPLRATFLLDDPNLHWTSYGHLRYRDIVRHADEHGYHAAMAMVPLDGWLAHPAAARLFRARADRLSLCFHGNDHVLQELLRPRSEDARRATLAQALRRVARFERRTGLRVARVMTAPHGGCSEEMARDMLALGYDALCIARPYPWAARPPASWLAGPADASPLAAFGASTLVTGGLPVLLRRPFDSSTGEIALRAYLDQPLVLYGHHDDLEGGLGLFADWAARVASIAPAHWTSLDEIARTNHSTRVEGDLLRVRMYGRRATVDVPAGVERLAVELPPLNGGDGLEHVVGADGRIAAPGEELALAGSDGRVEVSLVRRDALDPSAVSAPSWRPWPLLRRIAGEGRDRLRPAYRRLSSNAPTS
jgi:hypothetical protein